MAANRLSATSTAATDYAHEMLIRGESAADVTRLLADQFPTVTASKAMSAAVDRFSLVASPDPQTIIGWAFEAYREIYRKSLTLDDSTNAIRAIKELTALEARNRHVFDDDGDDDEGGE